MGKGRKQSYRDRDEGQHKDVACIIGVIDALIGIVEFHAIELEPCVLVFGNETGVEA